EIGRVARIKRERVDIDCDRIVLEQKVGCRLAETGEGKFPALSLRKEGLFTLAAQPERRATIEPAGMSPFADIQRSMSSASLVELAPSFARSVMSMTTSFRWKCKSKPHRRKLLNSFQNGMSLSL
ncbi:hypothetical protein AT5A_27406, partial [Agrobacterium tumefaciens 5A]